MFKLRIGQAKKKRLTVTRSTRCEMPFWAPFDAVFDTFCPGNERCPVKSVVISPKLSTSRKLGQVDRASSPLALRDFSFDHAVRLHPAMDFSPLEELYHHLRRRCEYYENINDVQKLLADLVYPLLIHGLHSHGP
jgi:hypothetical protein